MKVKDFCVEDTSRSIQSDFTGKDIASVLDLRNSGKFPRL